MVFSMSLSIAVFVPEGIVIGCDKQAEVNNFDDGFIQPNQSKLFTFSDRFLVNIIGSGFSRGLPYAYYVERVFYLLMGRVFHTTCEFAKSFDEGMSSMIEKNDYVSYYIAGVDISKETIYAPVVYLVEDHEIKAINRGIDGSVVYNYHTVGDSVWVEKLIMPTFSRINDEEIYLEEASIDFSKYSKENAINFVKSMMAISNSMDIFAQIPPRVGCDYSIGVLSLNSKIDIF